MITKIGRLLASLVRSSIAASTSAQEITIPAGTVSEDLFDFPLMIRGNQLDPSIFAATKGDGSDIIVRDTLGNRLPRELAAFDQSAPRLVLFVRIPIIHAGQDTKIVVEYGDPETSETNSTLVWSAGYTGVYHGRTSYDEIRSVTADLSNDGSFGWDVEGGSWFPASDSGDGNLEVSSEDPSARLVSRENYTRSWFGHAFTFRAPAASASVPILTVTSYGGTMSFTNAVQIAREGGDLVLSTGADGELGRWSGAIVAGQDQRIELYASNGNDRAATIRLTVDSEVLFDQPWPSSSAGEYWDDWQHHGGDAGDANVFQAPIVNTVPDSATAFLNAVTDPVPAGGQIDGDYHDESFPGLTADTASGYVLFSYAPNNDNDGGGWIPIWSLPGRENGDAGLGVYRRDDRQVIVNLYRDNGSIDQFWRQAPNERSTFNTLFVRYDLDAVDFEIGFARDDDTLGTAWGGGSPPASGTRLATSSAPARVFGDGVSSAYGEWTEFRVMDRDPGAAWAAFEVANLDRETSLFSVRLLETAPEYTHPHAQELTIPAGAAEADLVDFPVLISGEVVDPHLFANIGDPDNDGQEIVVRDPATDQILPKESVRFDAATNTLELYALIPTIRAASETKLRIEYGNADLNAANSPEVWTSDYVRVYHCGHSYAKDSVNNSSLRLKGSGSFSYNDDGSTSISGGEYIRTNLWRGETFPALSGVVVAEVRSQKRLVRTGNWNDDRRALGFFGGGGGMMINYGSGDGDARSDRKTIRATGETSRGGPVYARAFSVEGWSVRMVQDGVFHQDSGFSMDGYYRGPYREYPYDFVDFGRWRYFRMDGDFHEIRLSRSYRSRAWLMFETGHLMAPAEYMSATLL